MLSLYSARPNERRDPNGGRTEEREGMREGEREGGTGHGLSS